MPSHHRVFRFLPLLLLAASAHGLAATTIDSMRSNDAIHGLYEIREKAREFVAQENARTQSTWEAIEPNLKVLVPRCAVPLQARWDTLRWSAVQKGELVQHTRRVIAVVCARAVSPAQKWDVHVPVAQRR